MNQQPSPGYGQQAGQSAYMPPQQSYSVAQPPNTGGNPGSYGQQMQAGGQYQQGQPQMGYQQQMGAGATMPPPPQQVRSGTQPNGSSGGGSSGGGKIVNTTPPESVSKSQDGKTYKLEVVQEPVRARMCGFGDKDRRPITPPPCVRLVIIDDKTGAECEPGEFDVNFFILTVDLWDDTGHKEVNLVRHSATSPSISAATSSSYPPPTAPVYPFSANTAATANAHSVAAAHATGMQVHVGMTSPGYGPTQFGAHHTAPYMSQPPHGSAQGHHPSQAAAMAPYGAPDPVHGGSRGQEPQSYYVSATGQTTGAAVPYGGQYAMPGYAQNMQMLTPPHAPPMDPRSAPSGMFTRNLIGSLAVNGNPLTDPAGKQGIWFILQDLSVRTEGVFRLKMQFCCVADPQQKNTLNRGTAPILASTFSAPFQVYSAKKFPGVIESTPLSKCFAMQGVKIPIRKDGPTGKAAEVDDDANE